ncbi:MAG: hypothetical protein RJR34_11450 [Candidatus Methanoculleus thermohydrogenotrophicum]|nr:hypothetical protein [Candidatus Methanoculleus thermohydrogenotrophicum]
MDFVYAKNPDELADRILILLQNDEMREEMSANNREKAEAVYWDKVTGTVERIYFECLGKYKPSGKT